MSVLLHISDTHFGTEQADVVAALLHLETTQRPDAVVLSGDITQRARRHQFAAAATFLAQLQAPARVVLPGNHDIPLFDVITRLRRPYRGFEQHFGATLEPQFCDANFLIVGVNSTRASRHKNGEISAAQIERVAERLHNAEAKQLRVVALHHPVIAITESDRSNVARASDRAIRAWSQAGADLILGGHIHLPYLRPLHETMALPRAIWAGQAGTAASRRTRGAVPNSVNIVRWKYSQRAEAVFERWDYAADQKAFALIDAVSMQCER